MLPRPYSERFRRETIAVGFIVTLDTMNLIGQKEENTNYYENRGKTHEKLRCNGSFTNFKGFFLKF
jgi:hypothetical protein